MPLSGHGALVQRAPIATPATFTTIAEFRARLPDGATLASDAALAVASRYFLITIDARQGAAHSRARALVRRGGATSSTIVWQVVE